MKNVYLTGATGFLGRNLLKALIENGYQVSILARSTSDFSKIDTLVSQENVYLADKGDWEQVFKDRNIDFVIHTAALYGRKGETSSEILNANLRLPLEILEFCLKYGVRHFFNTDTTLPRILNAYALSKKQFLDWLEFYSSSVNVINLELEYFYGPGDDAWKFVTFVVRKMQEESAFIDFTEATQFRDFIYIDDLVNAVLLLIKEAKSFTGLTNVPIGSGQAIMLKDIIKEIKDTVGAHDVQLNFGAIPMRSNEIMYSCADTSILKSMGWEPKFTLKEGIKELLVL